MGFFATSLAITTRNSTKIPGRKKDHSSTIASVGQTGTHAPQFTHLSGSIHLLLSFSLIAPTAHSLSQAPQFTQPSVTL